jgi:D-beta-D-heptose 7-phosphate kinase/D-beta-D-heptose 1-phosphate adenosyltransferase
MTVVFTNGCFDILHRGHVELLRFCKKRGRVIVGLNSDESVKKIKGDSRPVNTQDDRKFLLSSLVFVDDVIIFDDETPYDLIKQLKPDLIVKGGDYDIDNVSGNDLCEVLIFDYVKEYSTTKLLHDISNR